MWPAPKNEVEGILLGLLFLLFIFSPLLGHALLELLFRRRGGKPRGNEPARTDQGPTVTVLDSRDLGGGAARPRTSRARSPEPEDGSPARIRLFGAIFVSLAVLVVWCASRFDASPSPDLFCAFLVLFATGLYLLIFGGRPTDF